MILTRQTSWSGHGPTLACAHLHPYTKKSVKTAIQVPLQNEINKSISLTKKVVLITERLSV